MGKWRSLIDRGRLIFRASYAEYTGNSSRYDEFLKRQVCVCVQLLDD